MRGEEEQVEDEGMGKKLRHKMLKKYSNADLIQLAFVCAILSVIYNFFLRSFFFSSSFCMIKRREKVIVRTFTSSNNRGRIKKLLKISHPHLILQSFAPLTRYSHSPVEELMTEVQNRLISIHKKCSSFVLSRRE